MTDSDILKRLPHWSIVNQKLTRQFIFKDFIQAFDFMTKIAIVAEKMDHHPEWSNSYNTVDVELITHSQGCITQLDIELATHMNDIFKNHLTKE
ncbi:MAG: 4a-hydroxytetrahydrobiopterin dehydratase [Proteobacteria bacterium]|nr:4a-hydroxytetrahydrobiopterin dehydratase [Pseudomonadota bacterium]MCH9712169.1 4a-hydroxytetrahydrobiopterin dehydratase [Pseudomonadota bacterium]MCH9750405.1 4a-hydroxytetrahydrobiopterin dehydratase [Pseudomonadota bacterium]